MATLVWGLGLLAVCVVLGLAAEALLGPLDLGRESEDEE